MIARATAAAVVFAVASSMPIAQAAVTATDDSGATITLDRPARRVVTLGPHLTEQLFAIGAGDRIVGTTEYSDYPAAAQRIPRVGRAHSIDLERVAALKPELVLIWGSGFPPATVEAVRRLSTPMFISEPRSLDDIASSMERLGTLTGVDGSPAGAGFRQRVRAARERYAGQTPVRVFYQIWSSPLMTLSGRHVISEVIGLCGGANVFADLAPLAPQVSVEAVVAADPQIILTAEPEARPSGALDSWLRLRQISAVKRGALVTVDANRINRHGPRLADEIDVICDAIDRVRRAPALPR